MKLYKDFTKQRVVDSQVEVYCSSRKESQVLWSASENVINKDALI